MIEVQLKSKEIYDSLKMYASYASDLTLVCAFRDEMKEMLKSYGVEFEDPNEGKEEEIKEKPTLTLQGSKIMKLINAPAEMLHYVGVRSEFDPTIPIANIEQVHKLIEKGLIKRDEKFKSLYSPIGYNAKINDLICANVKFYGKGKLTDYLDGDSTIRSLKISEITEKPIIYKHFKLKVYSPVEAKERYEEFMAKDITSGNNIKLRFFNKPIILKSIAFKGNEISVSTAKVQQEGNYFVIYDPIILPKEMEMFKDIMVTPKGRKVPAMLWRNAYYEFMYRYHANEYKD